MGMNQIFLFVAVTHNNEPDFHVYRHDSRQQIGKSSSSPWLMTKNRKIWFVSRTHRDQQENLVCRRDELDFPDFELFHIDIQYSVIDIK